MSGNDTNMERWQKLHRLDSYRDTLPAEVRKAWAKSASLQIDPMTGVPAPLSAAEFKKAKEDSKFLYVCAHSALKYIAGILPDENVGFALFSAEGHLLRLYGDERFLNWCASLGISAGTLWHERLIGANAVSLGLQLKKAVTVKGAEHFSRFATDTAMSFHPVMMDQDKKDQSLIGGIAAIFPAAGDDAYISIIASLLSREINLMSFSHKAYNAYVNVGTSGVVTLDQSNGKNHILLTNEKFDSLFNPEKLNLRYRRLESVFNPLPQNKEFWNIVNNRIPVEDFPIEIVMGAKKFLLNLNSLQYEDTVQGIVGIALLFDSPHRIQKLISKYSNTGVAFTFDSIVGAHPDYLEIVGYAKSASLSEASILLLGESGVGKDIFAQAIHANSSRKNGPFVPLNCATFSKELIASELFGYAEGSFTGAKKGGNIGKFEMANNGTLFLDEIGDMPLDLQATLLRVIEQQSFMRVGGQRLINVDVRIIAATNTNLYAKVQKGLFREDLYYRLGVIRINVPPLRNRGEDILLLADYFIQSISARINKTPAVIGEDARQFLLNYSWPGNVRELKNLFEGILYINDDPVITCKCLERYLNIGAESVTPLAASGGETEPAPLSMPAPPRNCTKEDIIRALRENDNNKTKAAKALNISRRSFYRKLEEYSL